MSLILNAYRQILNLPLSLLVKKNPIPSSPINELKIDLTHPVLYILPYESQADLMVLRKNCLATSLPDPTEKNHIGGSSLPRVIFLDKSKNQNNYAYVSKVFHQYLDLHKFNSKLNLQVIPSSVLWGRSPGKEGKKELPNLRWLSGMQKCIATIWWGRDTFVRFSPAVSLRYMINTYGEDPRLATKLTRLTRIHFSKQRLASVGPRLPQRQAMLEKLLNNPEILKAIKNEARSKNIPYSDVRQEALKILDEIAADMRYENLRMLGRFLSWLWNKLYQGIEVKNADRVRKLALDGQEIVYIPCHRSHIDYLLLSYLLYYQGIVTPHIAAGINLNFPPVGRILRRGGAFFIRRSFKGNRLYSTIFREYLAELFYRGYPVEYFIEGGRSRTGRLLQPKTGMMSMTLQAFQKDQSRPISIVPVYIGYEHVLEVDTYANELRGATKEKESAGLVLKVIKKLRNLGKAYVNFGEPISLNQYLNKNFPEWKNSEENSEGNALWLNQAVADISSQVMVNINNAAAVNAMNLISSILLSSRQRALTKDNLLEQISSYQSLLNNVPYSEDLIIPQDTPAEMLKYAFSLERMGLMVEKDNFGEIIRLERNSSMLITYYRNNIQHLLVLPSLVARMVLHYQSISQDDLIANIRKIYPFIQQELFLHFDSDSLDKYLNDIIQEFFKQELICFKNGKLAINSNYEDKLQLWSAGVRETIQRYYITVSILLNNPTISRAELEKLSQTIAQRLSVLHGINAPEFFDKSVFISFNNSLKEQGFFDVQGLAITSKLNEMWKILHQLILEEVALTVNNAIKMDNDFDENSD